MTRTDPLEIKGHASCEAKVACAVAALDLAFWDSKSVSYAGHSRRVYESTAPPAGGAGAPSSAAFSLPAPG
jgi:hypothetical protein